MEITRGRPINTLKKVILWRLMSVLLTYVFTFAYSGSIKTATAFTLFLHVILMTGNFIFEILWEEYGIPEDN
jgi:asparagine N-glycosylation enzyme membrane subunit Stt3